MTNKEYRKARRYVAEHLSGTGGHLNKALDEIDSLRDQCPLFDEDSQEHNEDLEKRNAQLEKSRDMWLERFKQLDLNKSEETNNQCPLFNEDLQERNRYLEKHITYLGEDRKSSEERNSYLEKDRNMWLKRAAQLELDYEKLKGINKRNREYLSEALDYEGNLSALVTVAIGRLEDTDQFLQERVIALEVKNQLQDPKRHQIINNLRQVNEQHAKDLNEVLNCSGSLSVLVKTACERIRVLRDDLRILQEDNVRVCDKLGDTLECGGSLPYLTDVAIERLEKKDSFSKAYNDLWELLQCSGYLTHFVVKALECVKESHVPNKLGQEFEAKEILSKAFGACDLVSSANRAIKEYGELKIRNKRQSVIIKELQEENCLEKNAKSLVVSHSILSKALGCSGNLLSLANLVEKRIDARDRRIERQKEIIEDARKENKVLVEKLNIVNTCEEGEYIHSEREEISHLHERIAALEQNIVNTCDEIPIEEIRQAGEILQDIVDYFKDRRATIRLQELLDEAVNEDH